MLLADIASPNGDFLRAAGGGGRSMVISLILVPAPGADEKKFDGSCSRVEQEK